MLSTHTFSRKLAAASPLAENIGGFHQRNVGAMSPGSARNGSAAVLNSVSTNQWLATLASTIIVEPGQLLAEIAFAIRADFIDDLLAGSRAWNSRELLPSGG